jgi:hypothetical protein
MSAIELIKDVNFEPANYNPHDWFIEQEAFNLCAYDDEAIDIPVLVISEYTMAHYKYYISICCEKNLDDFYECLGTQPLKLVFSHLIDDNYVKRHGFNVFPDTNLSRDYHIEKNELYLDTNEIELDIEDQQNDGEGFYIEEELDSDSDLESELDSDVEEEEEEKEEEEKCESDDELGLEGLESVKL